jgi:Skp family chaperone for outer membrane proteins
MKKNAFYSLASLMVFGLATQSLAQAPAVPAPQLNPGPAIPGVCIYSVEAAIGQSAMGAAAAERMKQLQAVVEAEIKPEREAIEAQGASLQSEQKTATREQFAPKAQAFQQRAATFEEKINLRVKELQATQQKAQSMIASELEAPLQAAYQEKGCGMLVDRNAVLFANPAMDITQTVVLKLNDVKKTISFDRERLDTTTATRTAPRPAAPAARPAATSAPKPAVTTPKPVAPKPAATPKPAAN